MTWTKGEPWRVVRSLERLREQIRAAYPQAVPPATPAASWGSIADSAHSTSSDHCPHYYSALGSTAVVCARDFPHAPSLGLDAHKLADQLRRSRDPRIAYVISNGRITGPAHDWQWDPYSGSDPHDTHIHVSTVHTAAADDGRNWQIGEAPDMDATQAKQLGELYAALPQIRAVHGALLDPDNGMDRRHLAQLIKDLAFVLIKGPAAGSTAWVGGALTRIAEASGVDAAELEQITAAAREGAASAADELVAAVLSKLPPDQALTQADVAQAVRDAFAGGLAPAAAQG